MTVETGPGSAMSGGGTMMSCVGATSAGGSGVDTSAAGVPLGIKPLFRMCFLQMCSVSAGADALPAHATSAKSEKSSNPQSRVMRREPGRRNGHRPLCCSNWSELC